MGVQRVGDRPTDAPASLVWEEAVDLYYEAVPPEDGDDDERMREGHAV